MHCVSLLRLDPRLAHGLDFCQSFLHGTSSFSTGVFGQFLSDGFQSCLILSPCWAKRFTHAKEDSANFPMAQYLSSAMRCYQQNSWTKRNQWEDSVLQLGSVQYFQAT
jgi:hypothetical protein